MTLKILLLLCLAVPFKCDDGPEIIYIDESEIPELRYMNRSVDPCDNFYQYTCGNFKNVKPRPDDEPIWDQFVILQKTVHETVKAILESRRLANEPAAIQKAKAFYTACTNTHYIDSLRLGEAEIVNELGGWPLIGADLDKDKVTWEDIGDVVSEYGLSMFFDVQVGPNLFNGSENAIWLLQDTMPNPSTIIPRLEDTVEIDWSSVDLQRNAQPTPYIKFMRKIALRVQEELQTFKSRQEIYHDIDELLEFIKLQHAGGILDKNPSPLSYTPTLQELQAWTDKEFGRGVMNWSSYLNHIFKRSGVQMRKDMRIMVPAANKTYGIINMIRQTEPRIIQNFLLARLFTYTAPDSDKVMREAFDTFYQEQNWMIYPRSQYCLRKTIGLQNSIDFSMALTYAYQRFHFNINKLESAAEMVTDLHNAFRDILQHSDWMDDKTKELAFKKVDNMITLLGYPEYVEAQDTLDNFYGNIRICSWDHSGNSQRMRSFRIAIKLQEIGGPRDRSLWQNSPLEVNAFYNRPNNRIVFPASILDPVFYTGYISPLDYGRIGAIIGHEITHGFDNKGRTYDHLGGNSNIWSEETNQAFNKKTECFKDQYSGYYIEEIDKYVNGSTTLDENLADNGGLREAFLAFEKLIDRKKEIITVEGFTPEQLFFIGFGTMWCMQESEFYLNNLYNTGIYAPGRHRVNGAVSNNKYFAEAFSCPVGSNMNPENKCILW